MMCEEESSKTFRSLHLSCGKLISDLTCGLHVILKKIYILYIYNSICIKVNIQ